MILAAIDIGSNAARLLISEASVYEDGSVDFTKLNLIRVPLRLGMDVFETGIIESTRKQKLIDTLKVYQLLIRIYDVEAYRVCATSAMRDAKNGRAIMEDVLKETGLHITTISGQEEANIIYETHIAEKLSPNKSYLYIDVGGGSTEITLFSQNRIVFKDSFNIGTIRLLQGKVQEAEWERAKTTLKANIRDYQPIEAIGSGGNINKIFSMSRRKEGKPLSLELLRGYYEEMSQKTVAERRHIYSLKEDRADVIVPALEIFIKIMRWADADEIFVPKIGLADGIIRMLYKEQQKAKF